MIAGRLRHRRRVAHCVSRLQSTSEGLILEQYECPRVAFLVVCWNNIEIIDQCLTSLFEQSYANHVVHVIDNGSSDGSAEYIAAHYPAVKLIASDANHGFAKGNNILVDKALADPSVQYVALVNSDAVIDVEWTRQILEVISSRPKVAAAQGITLDYSRRNEVDSAHVYVGTNLQSIQYGYRTALAEAADRPRRVFGVNAAAAVYTRDFVEDQSNSKLFDETFSMYLEDVDVSFRATVTGWNNFSVPAARAYHMGSASSNKKVNGFSIYMTLRNQPALVFKNITFTVFMRCLPGALRLEPHIYVQLLKNYGIRVALIACGGRLMGLIRLPFYFRSRIDIGRRRTITASALWRAMKADGVLDRES